MSGKKIFIGNLSYKTKEADLIDAFKKCGKVVDAKVVRKMNGLSKGFGFVEYEKEEDARKAVEELDKIEIFDRPINVQLSTSTGEKTSTFDENDNDNENDNENSPQRRSPKQYNSRPYRNDNRRPPRSNNSSGGYRSFNNNNSYNSNNNNRRTYTLTRRDGRDGNDRRDYGRRFNQNRQRPGYRRQRTNNGYKVTEKKQTNENENNNIQKVESKSTVFVANLPFAFVDENLMELFKVCGDIKTAHVVRTERRSRGYGFVEFENKEGQENALKKMNDFPVKNSNGEDRNLIVKIAVNVEDE